MSDEPTLDQDYWETHWRERTGPAADVNPYLAPELGGLTPGTALDAGCGEGAEAIWLAAAGWQVTAADISAEALARARARVPAPDLADRITWVEADLDTWEPESAYDLVTTHYAHPAGGQHAFYARIARWVAPAGTLLVVGHRGGHGHDESLTETRVSATSVAGVLDADEWEVVTAAEPDRQMTGGRTLHDVVVRATRRS